MLNKKTSHQHKGDYGESLAYDYLQQQGFVVLERNWRYKHCEVDIICKKNNVLHFVEVKTRTNQKFGNPEESINSKKMNALKKAAEEYLIQHTEFIQIQFDVIAIKLKNNKIEEILFIEDIFF
ncbi:MAG: YraN family protein [Chitinophagaceae bacterium]|nr:YraN family protein [Chitinophagaceae bacterium]